MIEIILDSSHQFIEAQVELRNVESIAGKPDYKPRVMIIKGLDSWRSDKQNKTFHKLLELLWSSACSSYRSYESMRNKYKEIAGLIKVEYNNSCMSEEGKNMLRKAMEVLPLSKEDKKGISELLRGRIEKEGSWADAKKDKATLAIDMLINEMLECNVRSSKVGKEFEEVMSGLEKEGKIGVRI